MLYDSYTLDIDSDNVSSCIFAQDRTLSGEARAKEYGRPFSELAHCCECCSDSYTPM